MLPLDSFGLWGNAGAKSWDSGTEGTRRGKREGAAPPPPTSILLFSRELLGTDLSWPLLLAFPGVAAFLQLLLLPFFPESPPYLLIQEGDEEGCLKGKLSLERLVSPQNDQGGASLGKCVVQTFDWPGLRSWRWRRLQLLCQSLHHHRHRLHCHYLVLLWKGPECAVPQERYLNVEGKGNKSSLFG